MTATEEVFDQLAAGIHEEPVTVETAGGFRVYGHQFEVAFHNEKPAAVAVTVLNGRTIVPWHAVNLIHVHSEVKG